MAAHVRVGSLIPATAVRRLLLVCAIGGGGAEAAVAGTEIFSEDFESGSFGPWSNGGDGIACLDDSGCLTGYCQNGYCCPGGDCCATAGDCSAYAEAPICGDAQSCQGTRTDAGCNVQSTCASAEVADDSACTSGVEALTCSPYLPIYCSGATSQTVPSCPSSCAADGECVASAHCDGVCAADLSAGAVCDESGDCASGSCVDGVCCTSACGGSCQACNLAGSEGTCASIPAGTDPDLECGAVSCVGYYWGWSGDTCYRRADVSASASMCNGANACQSTASACAASGQGSATLTCSISQDPAPGTCAGTTPGSCINI